MPACRRLPTERSLMPRPWVAAAAAVLAAGCGTVPPPEVRVSPAGTVAARYPARADWLVDQAPAVTPPRWNAPGFPPLKTLALVLTGGSVPDPERAQADALRTEVGKNVLDPAKEIPAADRGAVAKAVDALFGTPLGPAVPGPPEDVAALRLDPPTLARGAGVYRRWCVSCHGPAGAGDGPAASTLLPPPRDYRAGVFKFVTSTPDHGGAARRADLRRTLRRGLDGTMMPAFPDLSEDDLEAVVSYVVHLAVRGEAESQAMKRLIKAAEDADAPDKEVARAAGKAVARWKAADAGPVPVPPDPDPTPADRLAAAARGHDLFKGPAGCVSCHVDYGRAPKLAYDVWGNVVQPRNLTLGVYRGGRAPEDLYCRLYGGIKSCGMPAQADLLSPKGGASPEAAKADGERKVWDLVRFVQAVGNATQRAELRARHGVKLD